MLEVRHFPEDAVRVLAPDARHLLPREMTALGLGRRPGPRRAQQLDRCRHIVAMAGACPVGFAAFDLTNHDLLVYELSGRSEAALAALLTALELACLAAGATHLMISTSAAAHARLTPYGYRPAAWGPWFEKVVP